MEDINNGNKLFDMKAVEWRRQMKAQKAKKEVQ
jgi:hypothetical protein